MKKIIYDKNSHSKHFLKYLLKLFKEDARDYISSLNEDRFLIYDDYLNSVIKYTSIFNKLLYSKQILLLGIANFILREYPNEYVIELDATQKLPYLDITIEEVVRAIDDGNLELKGLHIIEKYINLYAPGGTKYIKVLLNWRTMHGSEIL